MSNQFNSVSGVSHIKSIRESRNGRNEAQFVVSKSTATSAAGAVTLHASAGTITTEALTTAAGATYTLTLTNSNINASSVVIVVPDKAASTGTPCLAYVTPGAGSATIVIQNIHAATAFNAAIKIAFHIIQ